MFAAVSLIAAAVATEPSGHYYGSKDVMFNSIKVNMETLANDPGYFSLSVVGSPGGNVNCPKEAYKVTGDVLSMPNMETKGDCAHDQFKAADLDFQGATYDSTANTITVKAKYLFIDVTIVCKKVDTIVAETP